MRSPRPRPPHTGAIPSAGPAGAGGMRGPGGMRGAGRPGGGFGSAQPPGAPSRTGSQNGTAFGGRGPGGGGGGILGSPTPSAELTALLGQDASSYTWVAAAV